MSRFIIEFGDRLSERSPLNEWVVTQNYGLAQVISPHHNTNCDVDTVLLLRALSPDPG